MQEVFKEEWLDIRREQIRVILGASTFLYQVLKKGPIVEHEEYIWEMQKKNSCKGILFFHLATKKGPPLLSYLKSGSGDVILG